MRTVTKAAYAAPAVGLAGLGLPLLIYLPEYYGTVVGLPLGMVGMAFLVARLADIIVDPLAGALIDRTRSRHGRFRFWLAAGTPLLMLAVYGLFMPPLGPPQLASFTRLVLCLAGTYAAWSLCFVAHLGWGATLSNDYDDRNAIFAWCQALFLVGGVAITAIPLLPALRATPGQALPAMGWFILLSLPVGGAFALLLVREHPAGLRRPPGWNDYRRLLGQAGIARLLAADVLSSTAVYAAGGVFFFYYGFIHGLGPAEAAALLFSVKLGAIAGAYLWGRLGTRLEKHRALALGFGGLALMSLVVHLAPWSGRTAGMIILGGFGVLLSADPVLVRSMMADLGDERRLATGADQMGTMAALLSVSDKLSAAIGPALALAALGWAGFDPQAARQTPLALNTLAAAAIWVPLLLHAAAVPLVWRHPLTASRHQAIRTELAVLEGGD